jgi:hypothetical protein
LAAAAAVMSIRETKGWERLLWTVVVFAFLIIEMWSIKVDRKKSNDEQAEANKEVAERFNAIAGRVEDGIKTSNDGFKRTTRDTAKVNTLVAESLRQLTSEGSFCYVEFVKNDEQFTRRRLFIATRGRYPLYDVTIIFSDPDGQKVASLDNPYPNALFFEHFDSLGSEGAFSWKRIDLPNDVVRKQYGVMLSARSGNWGEQIDLIKVNNVWHQAIRVVAEDYSKSIPEENKRVLFEQADYTFHRAHGHVRWSLKGGKFRTDQ